MSKPEPYSEDEKRLAKIHRCHPQEVRDFSAFIQHMRKESLALKHSIQLAKIEQKVKEIEKKLEIIKTWHDDLEYRLRYLENIQRKREHQTKQRGEPKMVSEGRGRLFRRKDGKYLIYVPKDLAEDSMFPFQGASSIKVKISFKLHDNRILIEKWYEPIPQISGSHEKHS